MQSDKPKVTQAETPLRMTSRELWIRHRGISLLSLVLGAFVGCVVIFVFSGDVRLLDYKVTLGSTFGAAAAAAACLGGFIALRVQSTRKAVDAASRVNAGASGAGVAVLLA